MVQIREMEKTDWSSVAEIYAQGIQLGYATFETVVPSYEDWDRSHLPKCRWVAYTEDEILGWAALSPVSSRCVYGGVAEVSIYVHQENRGLGIGKCLMKVVVEQSEHLGFWTLQSGIFPENESSIKLHEKMGFRFLGKREKIGKTKLGIWRDNLLFERRSRKIGWPAESPQTNSGK